MAELTEYRITFGLRYADETHPRFPAARPDGWVAVMAETEDAARTLVHERIGNAWAFIYRPDFPGYPTVGRFFPKGEIARWSTDEPEAPGTAIQLDLMNAQLVGVLGGKVLVQVPQLRPITPEQALVHAAWLVAIASNLDPTLPPFGEVLKAVQNT